jgi:hypothetical protein
MPRLTTTLKYYGIIAFSYIALALLLPANRVAQRDYHLTSAAYHALLLVVVLPFIGIWLGAFYSYARLKQYSHSIANTAEGVEFEKLANGFRWLAWGSAVTAILTLILNAIANEHPGFQAFSIIIANYGSLVVPLVGYSMISSGTRGLNIRQRITISGNGAKLLILLFMFVGVAYCYITFQHLNLHAMTASDNPYYLPAWLMIISVVVPFLYTWFIGFLAAYEMYLYSKHVDGVLYQRAIRAFSFGIIAVIASSITVQYLRSAIPRSGHLSLNATLLIINAIYVFMAAGYILITLGARQLRKIEEV